jgi:hypothetical protein
MYRYDLDPSLGPDNMRYLAGLRNEEARVSAQQSLLEGKSPDEVRTVIKNPGKPILPVSAPSEEDIKLKLEKEKVRIEKTIAQLNKRLEDLEKELGDL